MITMPALFNKSQRIIVLLFATTLFSIHPSKAQSITADSNSPLTLSINCPNNPQCIYSGGNLSIDIVITNNTNQNLEFPLISIWSISMSSYFKDGKTKEGIRGTSLPPGLMRPDLLKKLTLLPAHETTIIQKEASPNYIKKIFRKSSNNQIIYNVSIWTPIHIQGSQEPIGSYQNGKFEPKIFILEAETTITKQ